MKDLANALLIAMVIILLLMLAGWIITPFYPIIGDWVIVTGGCCGALVAYAYVLVVIFERIRERF